MKTGWNENDSIYWLECDAYMIHLSKMNECYHAILLEAIWILERHISVVNLTNDDSEIPEHLQWHDSYGKVSDYHTVYQSHLRI